MPPHITESSGCSTPAPDVDVSKPKSYQIRSMFITDIPTVYNIDQITFGNHTWPLEVFFDCLDNSSYDCWILESTTDFDNPILGYGMQYMSDGRAHIANLCIHPDQRGKGFGEILLRHMINYACQIDISTVELEVDTLNEAAFYLYYKNGFRIVKYLEQYYSDTSNAYLMQLNIDRLD